jgi:surfactin synthase thioesterase subunit
MRMGACFEWFDLGWRANAFRHHADRVRTPTDSRVQWPARRSGAGRVLACLSYCGGGTAAFRPWAGQLPSDVDLALICYPGREGRYHVPYATDWPALMTDVVGALREVAARPYVLFGHSLGAWVAFEAAVRMEQLGLRPPDALVVSANDSPDRHRNRRERSPSSADSDADLLDWLSRVGQLPTAVLADPDLCQMAVELLRADLRMSSTYRYLPGVQVHAPMQVIHGTDDPVATPEAAQRWRTQAAGRFSVTELPGGHFYTDGLWACLPRHFAALSTGADPIRRPVVTGA